MHGSFVMFATNSEHAQGMMRGMNNQIFTADQMRAYAADQVAQKCDALRKDAERWRKSRRLLATKMFDYYLLEGEPESAIDAWVDAALAVGAV